MKGILFVFLIFVLAPMEVVLGSTKFTKGGFVFEVLRNGKVLISCARTVHVSQVPFSEEFRIPSSVEYQGTVYEVQGIASDGFAGCTEIRHLVIEEGVQTFGQRAFQCCINLLSVKLPASAGYGGQMFEGCHNLKSIVVDPNNDFIDSRDGCNAIIDIDTDELVVACMATVIPPSVNSIGEEAFANCSGIDEVVIPEGVKKIDDFAFANCINLKHITLPLSLESIGEGVFAGCKSLESLYIPKNVRKIEEEGEKGMFAGCDNLISVIVDKSNPFYDSREGCNAIVETKSSKVVEGCIVSSLVEGLKDIGGYAFAGTGIHEIQIPQSMTSFSANAFSDCDALSKLTVHKDNPYYYAPDCCNAVIRKDSAILVLGCVGTAIPEGIKVIGEDAFLKKPVAKCILRLPDGLQEIRERAFLHCDNLFEVIIPSSVTSIGMSAFSGCPQLAVVRMSGQVNELDELLFANCSNLAAIDLPEGISVIRWSAFSGCSKLNHIVFPSSLTSIEDGAFFGCPCEEDIKKLKLR